MGVTGKWSVGVAKKHVIDLLPPCGKNVVKMMRDAAAFQELKAKKPEVTRKAEAAPRVPVRQSTAQTRKDQELNNKFKAGRAKLNDLAALLR